MPWVINTMCKQPIPWVDFHSLAALFLASESSLPPGPQKAVAERRGRGAVSSPVSLECHRASETLTMNLGQRTIHISEMKDP